MKPSDAALEMVGQELTYTEGDDRIVGVCTEVRFSGTTIERDGKRYPGVQFRIAGQWSVTFPDYGFDE